jgi:hypothetical protein
MHVSQEMGGAWRLGLTGGVLLVVSFAPRYQLHESVLVRQMRTMRDFVSSLNERLV